ncbi:MAG TPA: rod shape-determining protein MreD [Chitinophagales bacterium]|nr:rod shape-determining protein MreD [Chitinophagales bacterium]
MITPLFVHVFRFLLLLLVQVFVLNNVVISGVFNPYVYIYFLLLLPLTIPHWQLLLLSFFTGLAIDLFTHSIGLHAFACTFVGFIRPFVVASVQPAGGYNPEDRPTIGHMGPRWFLAYSIPIVYLFHALLFIVETLSVNQLLLVLLKSLVSATVALVIIVLFEFFFSKRRVR